MAKLMVFTIKYKDNDYNVKRGCNRMRFYRILVAALLKYKKHQEI